MYLRVTLCDSCGDASLIYRGSGGAVAAAVAESGSITADDVVRDIRTELRAGRVKVVAGTCWSCVVERTVSRETLADDLRPDVIADDPE